MARALRVFRGYLFTTSSKTSSSHCSTGCSTSTACMYMYSTCKKICVNITTAIIAYNKTMLIVQFIVIIKLHKLYCEQCDMCTRNHDIHLIHTQSVPDLRVNKKNILFFYLLLVET